MVQGLSCSQACGIFSDQWWNLCSLNWQEDSYPLCHQGSPGFATLKVLLFVSSGAFLEITQSLIQNSKPKPSSFWGKNQEKISLSYASQGHRVNKYLRKKPIKTSQASNAFIQLLQNFTIIECWFPELTFTFSGKAKGFFISHLRYIFLLEINGLWDTLFSGLYYSFFFSKVKQQQSVFILSLNSSGLGWSHLVNTDGYHSRLRGSGDPLRFLFPLCGWTESQSFLFYPHKFSSLGANKVQPPNLFREFILILQKSIIRRSSGFGSEWVYVTLLCRNPNVYIFICWYFN